MERKIGDTFEFEGKKLQVKESASNGCDGCFFYMKCSSITMGLSGECEVDARDDKKDVIFVEVQKQPHVQAEQPKELNLCEILKNCPKGFKLYSVVYGEVTFLRIKDGIYPICVLINNGKEYFSSSGKLCESYGECLLFPSKEQRDWSKFTAPWLKKERFDPKTLKAFDRVIVYGKNEGWFCTIFSHIGEGEYPYNTASGNYAWCIPYNDDTKYLVGTTDEAPDFYKYWED